MEPARHIVRRRVDIDFSRSPVDRWSSWTPETESAFNLLSNFFPPGESFFITSVKNYYPEIHDPKLKDDADRFIFQEAMHSRVHARCNKAVSAIDADGARVQALSGSLLALVRRWTPRSNQLAISCAIEHFTALLADSLLSQQADVRAAFDPAFAALWLWHVAEETEHKAVCFDIYTHFRGRGPIAYLHRVGAMFVTSLFLAGFVVYAFAQTPRTPGATVDGTRRESTWARVTKLMSWIPFRPYLDYYRWSFHPWDVDNRHLLEAWRQAYPGFGLDEAGHEAKA